MVRKVLIADDHPIFRAGLRQLVEEEKGYEVIAEAGDGSACIAVLEIIKPDLVVLDLAMPGIDGYGVLNWIKENAPDVIAIIISMHSSRGFATKAKELGARAFIAKEDSANELHNAFLTPKGVFYLSASVGGSGSQIIEPGSGNLQVESAMKLESLTPAEFKVFELVGQSLTSRQIGEKLHLSYRTVQTHRQRINQKLDLSGPNSLLQFALRHYGVHQ